MNFRDSKLSPLPYYRKGFLAADKRRVLLDYLRTLRPLWEQRYSPNHPPPEGDEERALLRPVYWLGNWQFACLGYYHPPKGIHHRSVRAESYPPVLREIVAEIEQITRRVYPKNDIPTNWKLNTCLINFYGSKLENGKEIDRARVGEHKDFEPGPVASLSLGDRAFFQFVSGKPKDTSRPYVVLEQWLEDCSLQIFAGKKWKEDNFHRVQRVEKKRKEDFGLIEENFKTRRINFTFRYVPEEHIVPFMALSPADQQDLRPLMEKLALSSPYFREELTKAFPL